MNKPTPEMLTTFKSLTPRGQFQTVLELMKGEEGQYFMDVVARIATLWGRIPKTYETDGQGREAIAPLHYFRGGCDWWIVERDIDTDRQGQRQMFGVADLGMGGRELGYIDLVEILAVGAELDFHYTPRTVGDIMKGG